MKSDVVVGIDLGGTKIAAAIFSSTGNILHKEVVLFGNKTGHDVGKLIHKQIQNCFLTSKSRRLNICAIGVSVPGISNQKTEKVWAPNIPGWKNYPLRAEIISTLKDKRISVTIESDRSCYILGETWQGAAKNCANAIFLAVGTGIGAGILVDGKILPGANDIAGAIGWMALQKPFRAEYISCGCFEHHASGEGLVKVAKELIAADKKYPGGLKNKKFTAFDIFKVHDAGDPIAKMVLEQAIEFWGMAAANLVSLFNPEKIIFGGGIFGPATKFLPSIFAEAKKWAQPISIQQVKFEPSKLGGDAGLYGAAYLALRTLRKHS
ncbi:MAG: ROK family protein [Verrucomicrobiota bacterium]